MLYVANFRYGPIGSMVQMFGKAFSSCLPWCYTLLFFLLLHWLPFLHFFIVSPPLFDPQMMESIWVESKVIFIHYHSIGGFFYCHGFSTIWYWWNHSYFYFHSDQLQTFTSKSLLESSTKWLISNSHFICRNRIFDVLQFYSSSWLLNSTNDTIIYSISQSKHKAKQEKT